MVERPGTVTTHQSAKHLWDGSEPEWKLVRVDQTVWRVAFDFAPSGPTKAEILALRGLLSEFRGAPTADVWNRLRGMTHYEAQDEFGNIERRDYMSKR